MSADTVVPGAGNPLAFDRYAYVFNNPLKYTDPTGHLLCSEMPWEEDCINTEEEINATLNKREEARIIAQAIKGELTAGGKEMLKLYFAYRNADGWWNSDGNFTIAEFLGLILLYEISNQTNADDFIVEATARQLWAGATHVGGNPPYCTDPSCTSGVFNFLAAYSESAWKHYYSDLESGRPSKPFGGDNRFGEKAAAFGERVLHPPSAWTTFDPNRPFGWGNDGTWERALRINGATQGMNPNQIVYARGNFIIYTLNQETYWQR